MKKLIIVSAMALLAVTAFGQGQVQFSNLDKSAAPNILAPIFFDSLSGAKVDGTQARCALLGGPTSATAASIAALNAGTLKMLASPNAPFATWVNFRTGTAAGYANVGSDLPRVVTDVAFGGQAMLQMVAWTGTATDWASAFAAALTDPTIKIGASNPWTVNVTQSAIDTGFARNLGLTSFFLAPIPEPSTLALAGLGAALLIFRRRK